ncbi:MAG: DUF4132 domain-containing protein [Planctomycetaceae bacterium]
MEAMRKHESAMKELTEKSDYHFFLPRGTWAKSANQDLKNMPYQERILWETLLRHCEKPTGSKPSEKWLTQAAELLEKIGNDNALDIFLKWFSQAVTGELAAHAEHAQDKTVSLNSQSMSYIKGMLWMIQCLDHANVPGESIYEIARYSFHKVPGVGPRSPMLGNAAVYALSTVGTVEAVGQLARLKVRVKSRSAQNEIEKAFIKSAEELGMTRDDVEELGVPTYGLQTVGLLEEQLGDYTARIEVDGLEVTLTFSDEKGKVLKSVPARVKSDHKEELKELRQSLKDIKGMLPAQRERVDALFMQQKSWPIKVWRERYLDHPLVGTIARRLIWCVDGTAVFFEEGELFTVTGDQLEQVETAEVTLWHPINESVDTILAWRDRLEELEITQPFNQVYREVYPLTPAERDTRTYSNRFAAHILRQHQFHALCATRGWKNVLRLIYDNYYPPAEKVIPRWGLRAEFSIESIGDPQGPDTNETGTFMRVVTDRVQFYRIESTQNLVDSNGGEPTDATANREANNINEPVPLEEIPELVFSEIMRDVDLFVGVASVGNDPTWQDGGPEGRYRDYWENYAFGELQESARTRKEVLARMIPRLKIASQCCLEDKFLIVEGARHVYKIHLGSGNILMSPNDKYLCIVPDAGSRMSQDSVYLPFEGDRTLSIILSKAFLLAADDKIKDKTILRQL